VSTFSFRLLAAKNVTIKTEREHDFFKWVLKKVKKVLNV
jgi:hypothetical protein